MTFELAKKTKPVAALKTSGIKGDAASQEFVLCALRDRIASHDLPPGSKLRENVLSEEFGVSRARIRDLFGALEERGLIERIPNRGAVVKRLEADQAFELFNVREVLEGVAIRLATQNMPPETWDEFIDLFGPPLEEAIARGDLEVYINVLARFRARMIEGADSPLLVGLLDSIYDRTRVLIRRLVILPGRANQGVAEHRVMLAAMRAGDAEKAEDLKRANIRSSRETFRKFQKFVL